METIAAISTATGNGGIGIIRMSGENCFNILEKIYKSEGALKKALPRVYLISIPFTCSGVTPE